MDSFAHADPVKHSNCHRAHQYALDVTEGKVVASQWVKFACQRWLKDLNQAMDDEWAYWFSPLKAEKAIRFIQKLPHVKGQWARLDPRTGRPARVTLEPWQCFIIANIFGWTKKSNGLRRFQRASVYVARKNGKSILAAGIGWACFVLDDEPGAEIYCGATSEKQAWEVFSPAKLMGEKEPDLLEHYGVQVNAASITKPGDGGKFMPIIGKPGDGASPHCYIVDEYHEHPDSTLLDTMQTGTGARTQPLGLIISTAGTNLSSPCYDDWLDCQKLLNGGFEDDTKFAILYTIDEEAEWETPDGLKKANPNWGVSIVPESYLPLIEEAKRKPGEQSKVKTKNFNWWCAAKGGWANMEYWNLCARPKEDLALLKGKTVWVGLDAAARVDIFSIVGIGETPDGKTGVFARHFIPQQTAALPENSHYRKWAAEGWLTITPGARTDQVMVEEVLKEWNDAYTIRSLGYDPKEVSYLMSVIQTWAGFKLVEINQGPSLMSEPMKELEALIDTQQLVHFGDPVLTWMMSNVVRREGRGGGPVKYYYPAKEREESKIDGAVALIMAIAEKSRDRVADSAPAAFF